MHYDDRVRATITHLDPGSFACISGGQSLSDVVWGVAEAVDAMGCKAPVL
jgi:hypothetical protein